MKAIQVKDNSSQSPSQSSSRFEISAWNVKAVKSFWRVVLSKGTPNYEFPGEEFYAE